MAAKKLTNVNNLPLDKNIILLMGKEAELKRRALNIYIDAIVTDDNKFNFEKINLFSTKVSAKEIINSITALAFLGNGRVIVIDGIDILSASDQKEIADVIKNVPPDNHVIFRTADDGKDSVSKIRLSLSAQLQKDIDKLGTVLEFVQLDESQALNYIADFLKEYDQSIEQKAAHLLIERSGTSLKRLTIELEKVSIFAGNDGKINSKMVEELTSVVSEELVFVLADAVSNNDSKKVVDTIKVMLDDSLDDPFAIFPMIIRQYRMIWQAKLALDMGWRGSGDDVKECLRADKLLHKESKFRSASAWQQKKFAGLARKMSWDKLRYIYKALLECDMASKAIDGVPRLDSKLALELLCEKIATYEGR